MTVIALTGGIGSGKSEAAKQFEQLGIPVVDADVIAHELTKIGEPTLKEIEHIFGVDFFNTDHTLNRAKLRQHVFENSNERVKLEAILHPAIFDRALKKLHDNENALHPPYQILVVPLLFENRRYDGVADKVLVIDCDEKLQIQRAMARSKMTESDVTKMMCAQVSRATRLSLANDVIINDGSLEELQEKVLKMHNKFIKTCIVSQ